MAVLNETVQSWAGSLLLFACAIHLVGAVAIQPAGAATAKFSVNERKSLGEAQADEFYVVGPSGDRF